MGLDLKDESKQVPINFTKDEINTYISRFRALDTGNKGYITVTDLRRYFKVCLLPSTDITNINIINFWALENVSVHNIKK